MLQASTANSVKALAPNVSLDNLALLMTLHWMSASLALIRTVIARQSSARFVLRARPVLLKPQLQPKFASLLSILSLDLQHVRLAPLWVNA